MTPVDHEHHDPLDFDELCHRLHPVLVGSLTLYTGDRDLAADLAQEALARAWRDWSKVSRMDSAEAWIHRVGVNLAHSWFRRLATRRRAEPRLVAGSAWEPTTATDLTVRRAVAELPRRQRQAVVLRYFAGLSVSEAAEAMRCKEGTVRALTSQGFERLRAEIGDDR